MEQSLFLSELYILSLWLLAVKENSINGSGVNQSLTEMHRYCIALNVSLQNCLYALNIWNIFLFPKNPSLHHPRAMFLGLTNEKIVLLSANSIRATVATENNKVWNVCWLPSLTKLVFFNCLQYILEKLFLQLHLLLKVLKFICSFISFLPHLVFCRNAKSF